MIATAIATAIAMKCSSAIETVDIDCARCDATDDFCNFSAEFSEHDCPEVWAPKLRFPNGQEIELIDDDISLATCPPLRFPTAAPWH